MEQVILVLTNLPDAHSARTMAHQLVEKKLAACVNCLPGVESVYRWQGEVVSAAEITLIIKTTQARYEQVELAIKASHPYQVPEIIAVEVSAGLPAYLNWIVDETKKENNE